MKKKYGFIVISLLLASILSSCSQENPDSELDSLIQAMRDSSMKLATNQPQVDNAAFAYNADEHTFYLGLTFKDTAPTAEEQKVMFEEYLREAGEVTEDNDWRNALKDFNVTFEQLLANNETKNLAVKSSDSEVIELICSACQSAKDEGTNEAISLDEWSSLSEKEVALNWDDLKEHSYEDIGSGVYIRKYEIEGGRQLFLTGKSLNNPPEKIYIIDESRKEISLTQDNLNEFYNLK